MKNNIEAMVERVQDRWLVYFRDRLDRGAPPAIKSYGTFEELVTGLMTAFGVVNQIKEKYDAHNKAG